MAISTDYLSIIQKPDNVPITIMLIGLLVCLWMAFRQAAVNDERIAQGKPLIEETRDDKVLCWPDLVYTELICLLLATSILILWSYGLRAPLESPANPAGPPNPSKAPWYFLGLQEMLVYFDPWMAGVLLPGLIVVGLIAMPFIDTNPKGNGYYTLKQRPFAIAVWLFGFLILWVVLIVFGTFLRGPNWNFFGPYEYWDSHRQVPLTNVNLSDFFWNGKNLLGFGLNKPLPTNPFLREIAGIVFTIFWVFILPVLLARTVLRKLFIEMGSARFYTMAVLFVFMGMLPLKMVLRWVFTLKYFVYLPEFNLNL
ncbi:MAG: cytochrome C [Planctomycetes bacterium]|nr:cytochrome C [Planctomycetota bacterium]